MAVLKNACILLIVIFMGWFYYKLSVSKITAARNYAFYMKMMLLIIIEIVDAFIDKRKSK